MTRSTVVVGGGLAGIAAALSCADMGARVTLVERRTQLGGLTRSFRHRDAWYDNGQHVFLRCCTAYLQFLQRIGAADDVILQDRMSIPVVRPGGPTGWLRRTRGLPAPLHLAGALLRYPHLPIGDRARIGLAALPLTRVKLDDPALDEQTFASWLQAHGQRPRAIEALWDLITVPTVNLPAAEASLAMAAKVFQTGLLTDAPASDVGWSGVPLGQLHGERAATALEQVGAAVLTGQRVLQVEVEGAGFTVKTEQRSLPADSVIVALPHDAVASVLPDGAVPDPSRLANLGLSAVVNVHVVYDRRVTDLPMAAGIDSPVQFVFDRTASAGLDGGSSAVQYLAVSLSAANQLLAGRPDQLGADIVAALAELFPAARQASVVDVLVTRERGATFEARPGTARLRLRPETAFPGLALAGAWTDTGWPATMEGAVRSGLAAARVALTPTSPLLPQEVA
jgi:squalene-associated FAD-dependent desaturase